MSRPEAEMVTDLVKSVGERAEKLWPDNVGEVNLSWVGGLLCPRWFVEVLASPDREGSKDGVFAESPDVITALSTVLSALEARIKEGNRE